MQTDGICDDVDTGVGNPEDCCSDYNQNGLRMPTKWWAARSPPPPTTIRWRPWTTAPVTSCYGDINGDGHIQLEDLLDLLQFFGLYCSEVDDL